MDIILKEKINRVVVLVIIVIAFVTALAVMLKYKTEGETNMPIVLKKVLIVSTAEAIPKSENTENQKWNLDINQYNDIYINFEKNEEYKKNSYIQSISIENINIEKPKVGEVSIYMPNSTEEKLFSYEDIFLVKDSLTYKGASKDNLKTLEIANQGGTFLFRVLNKHVGEYISNEDDEIRYDGTLLKKSNIKVEDLKTKINFDIVIKTNKTTYRGNITMEMPSENIEDEGVSQTSLENFDNIVFKRERNVY